MRTSTPIRLAASVAVCSLVLAACGQKPGVRVGDEGLAAGQVQDGTVQGDALAEGAVDDTGGAAATDTATMSEGATPGVTTTPGSTAGGATTTDQPQGQGQGGGQQQDGQQQGQQTSAGGGGGGAQVIGNDRTGAPKDKIVLGLHAPATGAAPLPTTSFNKAKDVYWKYIIEKKGGDVLGRKKVEVLFADDKYDPNSAGQVCKQLAAESFLVAGGGGTDQIQRCGQLAAVGQFPYFSAGVTEDGLKDNAWYFAASMSYRQQGGLLAQYVAKDPDGIQAPGADATMGKVLGPGAKIGTIITDTPNFKDAEQGWLTGLEANGLKNIAIFRHTKNDKSWISSVARDFKAKGVEVIYFLSSPTLFLDFANQADSSFGYNPLYIGPGVSKGLNAVLNGGCKAPGKRDDNAVYLSPFPGLDRAPKEFLDYSKEIGAPADDIAMALWGTNEAYHKMFLKYGEVYGNDLERQTFRGFVEQQAGTIESSIYPSVSYTKDNHFGANAASVIEANCDTKQWETLHYNKSGF